MQNYHPAKLYFNTSRQQPPHYYLCYQTFQDLVLIVIVGPRSRTFTCYNHSSAVLNLLRSRSWAVVFARCCVFDCCWSPYTKGCLHQLHSLYGTMFDQACQCHCKMAISSPRFVGKRHYLGCLAHQFALCR